MAALAWAPKAPAAAAGEGAAPDQSRNPLGSIKRHWGSAVMEPPSAATAALRGAPACLP
eukprot:CAMPEP_0179168296 /NCGR_PEP_ID=MMETSP0796-20121207/82781_1 /TAXON_ID=73915 /ORGANISM="Pyrodinium bahamense, Strain pbaha01" /LENGTH=58 /DNA_ID=CAMNT_0020871051 /DNA_START=13 /DNA_END=185 /DNA_ORIENTATION=-